MSSRTLAPVSFERRQFASDNYAGITPEAWEAISKANHGHAAAYGEDPWTATAADLLRDFFETDCEVFFVFNGTAANSLTLSTMCRSYHSIFCHSKAHVDTDECGAPEFFSHGSKVLSVDGEHGKITVEQVQKKILNRTDLHFPKAKAISITQSTELGTVYQVDEINAIADLAKRNDLYLHMDGARFANAVTSLKVHPKEITWELGIDVLCFGGTKIGMPVGDAVIFFNKPLAEEFEYRCKQAGQLNSKMRFISAAWIGMLQEQAILRYAAHANRCAKLLESKLRKIPNIRLLEPVEANACFVELPIKVIEGLREKGWHFYIFIGERGARLMCSWDTTEEDVENLVNDIRQFSS